ncbi:MAG: hypothetical protein K2G51_15805 [Lachnospiraceae bacterium]|nr:hypothetical protein [Lachnospiraceae bacterium]
MAEKKMKKGSGSETKNGKNVAEGGRDNMKEKIAVIVRGWLKRKVWAAACLVLGLIVVPGICLLGITYAADEQRKDVELLSEAEMELLNESFFNGGTDNMNNMLLTSEYIKPEEIDLFCLFYDGISGISGAVSEEETAQLALLDSQAPYLDIVKVTPGEMDAFLLEKLGIGLEETQKRGLENFYYLEQYDSFYVIKGDTGFDWCAVTSGSRQLDDTLVLEYEKTYEGGQWIVTLRKTDSGYQFVSNVRSRKMESEESTEAESDIPKYRTGEVITDVYMVVSAADDAAPMALLKEGMEVRILAEENEHYQIAIAVKDRNGDVTGYVKKEAVRPVS